MDKELMKISVPEKTLNEYVGVSREAVGLIREIAQSLKGITVCHLNFTAVGGGVAEMLGYEVAFERAAGLNSSWLVMTPDVGFFKITKKNA